MMGLIFLGKISQDKIIYAALVGNKEVRIKKILNRDSIIGYHLGFKKRFSLGIQKIGSCSGFKKVSYSGNFA